MKPSKPHLTYQTAPYSSRLLLSSPQLQPFVWLPWQPSLYWNCKEQRSIPSFYSSVMPSKEPLNLIKQCIMETGGKGSLFVYDRKLT